MRKQGKMALAAAVGLSVILAQPGTADAAVAGTAITGDTAKGWCQDESGGWSYYSPDGQRAVNTWIKSEDGRTAYYLDENGLMAANRMAAYGDGISYVDESGAQVRDCWVALPNDGLWDEPVKTVYYYFDSRGKAFQDDKKRVDGKTYVFDSEGRMRSGWYEEDGEYYYLGTEDEGWVHTGWQWLEPEYPQESGGLKQWYYFRPGSGKANRGRKKIDGSFYYFDQNTAAARMGWVEWEDWYAYYDPESGRMMTGWAYLQGPEESEEGWYYLDEDGVPFNYGGKDYGELGNGSALDYVGPDAHSQTAAITVQGDTYLFDSNGKMMTGQFYLWGVRNKGGKILGGARRVAGQVVQGCCYFFDNREGPSLGKMLRGRQTLTIEGTDYDYHFADDGMAYINYIVDGYLYGADGTREKVTTGDKYEVVGVGNFDSEVNARDISGSGEPIYIKGKSRKLNNCLLIIDRNGRVKKNGTVVINGYRYTVRDYAVVGTPEVTD